jgi:cytochrome c
MIAANAETKRSRSVRAVALMAALSAVVFGSEAALASDDPGKTKADLTCAVCHGPAGNKPIAPEIPRLAGQQYDYLVQVLNDYRHGRRENAIMTAIAQQQLNDREIRDLAAYYSAQQGLTVKR